MFGKQMKYYCSKYNRGNFSGVVMKRRTMTIITFQNHETTHANAKNAGTPQLQLEDDMKKAMNTLTGGMVDATDKYEPDF